MSTSILPGRRATAALLVAASLLELTETISSPLGEVSTSSAMGRIAEHQAQFTISVLCGMTAVLLFGPGFLGLANVCAPRVPQLARFAGWVCAVAMTGFFGVRGIQAVQLAMVRDGLDHPTAGKVVDDVGANPLGALVLVCSWAVPSSGPSPSPWRPGGPDCHACPRSCWESSSSWTWVLPDTVARSWRTPCCSSRWSGSRRTCGDGDRGARRGGWARTSESCCLKFAHASTRTGHPQTRGLLGGVPTQLPGCLASIHG